MSIKNSNDTIGNRTRDLPACTAVSQPTVPPRASGRIVLYIYIYIYIVYKKSSRNIFKNVTHYSEAHKKFRKA